MDINGSRPLNIDRYAQYMWGKIPGKYVGLKNPLPESTENIANGKTLYQGQCLVCHGASGKGDGPAGKTLVPRPANLAFTRRLPIATDIFFFWTMSEGGKSLGTEMPSFGERLSEGEIWQITHYINNGFDIHG
ncbi:MAG: cytochrome c [Pseudomonadota bacterium]